MKGDIMRKLRIVFLVVISLLFLIGCADNEVLYSLPGYIDSEYYTSGGFQDYTDYAKYTYNAVTEEDLSASGYFTVMTEADVDNILSYIANFESWVEAVGGEVKAGYDFDKTVISEGDYYYIKTKEGEPIGQGTYGKFDNYTVYFFDVELLTLFYFHSNI